ncbi:unnamed protein product [Vitrella brassicaformis CCMP3155]|uniref:Uncharacterized protein n=1 Tax=Vitrella brassicaformis (strain CCMP3155) TaxID=1169540 RepID=A0A0G4H1K5_VITBC|nr:unnamed protein product [Vitrella brassicaformis CCMP3155]|eukprot:CEM37498.1 unnamed protein product [Vitrella brassicaformis CCMP3155]
MPTDTARDEFASKCNGALLFAQKVANTSVSVTRNSWSSVDFSRDSHSFDAKASNEAKRHPENETARALDPTSKTLPEEKRMRYNHKEACQKRFSAKGDPMYEGFDSEVCEQFFRWLNGFRHIFRRTTIEMLCLLYQHLSLHNTLRRGGWK